jgi:hypothetical protein
MAQAAYPLLSTRIINVAMKLGNRQDLLVPAPGSTNTYSRIAGWLRDAYISLTMSNTFEQGEVSLPPFLTTYNQDMYAYPTAVRAIKSLVGYRVTDGTPVIPEWKDINYIRRYSSPLNASGQPNVGPPSIVCAFGNNLIFRPIPDQTGYQFFMDCWMNPAITADVVSTPLALPMDWWEVLDYEAAMRGHAELLERDKARELQTLLYGYTDPQTGAKVQGIVDRLGNRRQAQAPHIDYGMQPKFRGPYTGR